MVGYKISLKAARINAGLSIDETAKTLNISKPTLISWENGKTDPSYDNVKKLCELYGCPIEMLK